MQPGGRDCWEFSDLKAFREEAQTTPLGYGWSGIIALMPPLSNELMALKLLEWDEKFANEAEKRCAMEQNLRSSIPQPVDAAKAYSSGQWQTKTQNRAEN